MKTSYFLRLPERDTAKSSGWVNSVSAQQLSSSDFEALAPAAADLGTRGLGMLWKQRAIVDGRLPLIRRVMAARGFHDAAAVDAFLHPSLGGLHNPSLMPDLDLAAERILSSARAGEQITIYGDYDVDGITATAILYHTLQAVAPGSASVDSYVPHRVDEGYGLNCDAMRELAARGTKLVISVDCGVTAREPALVAAECGLELVITDHHTPPETVEGLPKAFAVVHPARPVPAGNTQYPFVHLCGAGVAFKLAWRLCTLACGSAKVSQELRDLLQELLALCALGVIADVVPLIGENRILAAEGLRRVKYSKLPGLRALVEASGLGGEKVSSEDVGFKLAPRLNACGRMGHAKDAVELFTTARGERATVIARQLTQMNEQRRRVEREIFEQAAEMVVAHGMDQPDRRAIVLASPLWHTGVVGIVCSRLVEKFHRPTILLGSKEGHLHGSGRSVDGFNLHQALTACSGHLLSYGGHEMAAGMRLEEGLLDVFRESFTQQCNIGITPEGLHGRATFDCDISFGELTRENVSSLQRLGPFGRENPGVCLRLCSVRLAGKVTTFGNNSAHLKFFVTDASGVGRAAMCIFAWRGAQVAERVPRDRAFDLLIKPTISDFSGSVECEMIDLYPGLTP